MAMSPLPTPRLVRLVHGFNKNPEPSRIYAQVRPAAHFVLQAPAPVGRNCTVGSPLSTQHRHCISRMRPATWAVGCLWPCGLLRLLISYPPAASVLAQPTNLAQTQATVARPAASLPPSLCYCTLARRPSRALLPPRPPSLYTAAC
jgi:hypothetical protein